MSPLHTIHNATVKPRCGDGAVLLLLEDGVYLALAGHAMAVRRAYVLREDLIARGLDEAELAPGITPIGIAEFVALTAEHNPIVGWM